MANSFLSIPVPSANGVGASVDISTLGWIKSIVLSGSLVGCVNVEVSDNDINWSPLITFYSSEEDTKIPFATKFVRARVSGYVRGTSTMSVGAEVSTTTELSLPVPAGNGTGADVDVSLMGQRKTILYSGGTNVDVTCIVEVSTDNVVFTQLASFQGATPARLNFVGTIQTMRVTTRGFVRGTPVMFVADVPDAGAGGVSLQDAYDASGNQPTIVLDSAQGPINIQDDSPPLNGDLLRIAENGGGNVYFAFTVTTGVASQLNIGSDAETLREIVFIDPGTSTIKDAIIRTDDATVPGEPAAPLSIFTGDGIISGVGTGGTNGGALGFGSGVGGDTADVGESAGVGGGISITAGSGGGGSATDPAGNGGSVFIAAGPAGIAPVDGGSGGAVTIQAGGSTGVEDGANVTISSGSPGNAASLGGSVILRSVGNGTNPGTIRAQINHGTDGVVDCLEVVSQKIIAGANDDAPSILIRGSNVDTDLFDAARISFIQTDSTAAGEDGRIEIHVAVAGALTKVFGADATSALITTAAQESATAAAGGGEAVPATVEGYFLMTDSTGTPRKVAFFPIA